MSEIIQAPSEPEPWLRNKHWAEGKIRDNAAGEVAGAWLLTLVVSGFAVATALAIFRNHHNARHELLVMVAGGGLSIGAIATWILVLRKTWQTLRFGRSTFEMTTFPGVVGGALVGIVYVGVKLRPVDGYQVRLSCFNQHTSSSGGKSQTSTISLWHDDLHLAHGAAEEDKTRTAIPVAFTIPFACKPTGKEDRDNVISWKLVVSAKLAGVDYHADFTIPVFRTADSAPQPTAAVDPIATYRAPEPVMTGPIERGVHCWQDSAGELHLRCAAARNVRTTFLFTLFAGLFVATSVFLWREGGFAWLMAVPFSFVTLLLVVVAVISWLQSKSVVITSKAVVLTTRILFFARRRTVATGTVEDVAMPSRMSSGEREWFDLDLCCAGGKKMTIANNLEKRDAEWLRERIMGMIAQ